MKANFSFLYPGDHHDPERDADAIAGDLANTNYYNQGAPICVAIRSTMDVPKEFENHYLVDVMGKEFAWLNESFPKDRYKWYHWYESVFLVPPEMATFLILRWT